jgi:hypothetical protein
MYRVRRCKYRRRRPCCGWPRSCCEARCCRRHVPLPPPRAAQHATCRGGASRTRAARRLGRNLPWRRLPRDAGSPWRGAFMRTLRRGRGPLRSHEVEAGEAASPVEKRTTSASYSADQFSPVSGAMPGQRRPGAPSRAPPP